MRTPITLPVLATTLLALVACSSVWSMTEEAPAFSLVLSPGVEQMVFVDLTLESTEPLQCDDLRYEISGTWSGEGTNWDTSEGNGRVDPGYTRFINNGVWEQDGDNRCIGGTDLGLQSAEDNTGDLVLTAYASDNSSSPEDDPEGDITLSIAVSQPTD